MKFLVVCVATAAAIDSDAAFAELVGWLTNQGHPLSLAASAADAVCELYPGESPEDVENQRMKASHYLQVTSTDDVRGPMSNSTPARFPADVYRRLTETPSPSCADNVGCQDLSGDCCPQVHGELLSCCTFVPPAHPEGRPNYQHHQTIPGEDLRSVLHQGAYLGPLLGTHCSAPEADHVGHGVSLHDCAEGCTQNADCEVVTFRGDGSGDCRHYTRQNRCRVAESHDGTELFVKNLEGMTPHRVPTRRIAGNSLHFFAVGDWGSHSCPGRASMHYVTPRERGSQDWNIDHNAQDDVATLMGELADIVRPFTVVNVGDNFYWGGVPNRRRGGHGIHDDIWNVGFELVYHHESLQVRHHDTVPWLSIMGNHDYGGDGCFADIRAQFDYTVKDLVQRNRWKMPSPYYSHRVEFDGGMSAEFFMLDSNVEDSRDGRHGGICKQSLCASQTVPEAECQEWFRRMFNEMEEWLERSLHSSTATWKIIGMHHKPVGHVGNVIIPIAARHNVHLIISGHTHETALHAKYHGGPNLLVVGQGGGAQARPECSGAIFCGDALDYSFADLEITASHLKIQQHRGWDRRVLFTHYVCAGGETSSSPCVAGSVV